MTTSLPVRGSHRPRDGSYGCFARDLYRVVHLKLMVGVPPPWVPQVICTLTSEDELTTHNPASGLWGKHHRGTDIKAVGPLLSSHASLGSSKRNEGQKSTECNSASRA
jgi:hypothetical protein